MQAYIAVCRGEAIKKYMARLWQKPIKLPIVRKTIRVSIKGMTYGLTRASSRHPSFNPFIYAASCTLPTSGVFTVFVKALPEFQAPNKTLFCSLLCLALACAHTGFNYIHHVVAKLLTL